MKVLKVVGILVLLLLSLLLVSAYIRLSLNSFQANSAEIVSALATSGARAALSALPPDEYKALAAAPNVRNLTRDTEAYVGQIVTYSGDILQVMEEKGRSSDAVAYMMRFAVDGDYDSLIVAWLIYQDGEGWRPLEDDTVTIWGEIEGRQEYKTILGEQIVVPSVTVRYIELLEP